MPVRLFVANWPIIVRRCRTMMPPFRASRIYLMLAILKPFEQNFRLWREPAPAFVPGDTINAAA